MQYRGLFYATLAVPFVLAAPAWGQDHREVTANRTDQPIVLNGELEEVAWGQADIARDFVQVEPHEGEPATEATEVRVLYDANNLYFGVTCFHSKSGTIKVNQLGRDFPITDTDVFGLSLDSFHDRRDTFTFFTNPGGAQRDEQSFDDGRFLNTNWDGIWEVATRVAADRWTAEIRIPFKTLRSERPMDDFGVNFFRSIRHKNEQVYWSQVTRAFTIHRASLAGNLLGLQGVTSGTNLRIKPGFVSRLEHRSGAESDTDLEPQVSVDAKYGLTRALTLDLTVWPDFSQVEVDTEQINLTRFNLFFPEKRDFFLENEGFFHFGDIQGERGTNPQSEMRLFYSRRVGLSDDNQPISILGGARLSGRVGAYSLGLLNIQQAERDEPGRPRVPPSNFTVLRLRRNIFSHSDIGVAYVGRESSGASNDNRAYGVDANFRVHQHLTSNFYVAQTKTPGRTGNDTTKKAAVQWTDSFKMLQFVFADIGQDFNPDVGFIERTGMRHYRAAYEVNPRPKPNRFVRTLQPHSIVRYSTDPSNRMLSRDDHHGMFVFFHDGGRSELAVNKFYERLDVPFQIRPGIFIPVGGYHFWETNTTYSSDRSKPIAGSISLRNGTFWDGRSTNWRASVFFVKGAKLSASVSYSSNRVRLAGGNFTANLTGVKVDYSFNPRMFLNTFVQYNSDTDRWITNVRFRLIHRPLSDIFVVYTEDNPLERPENFRAFLVKYTRAFEF